MKKVINWIRNKRDARFKKRLERVLNGHILDARIYAAGDVAAGVNGWHEWNKCSFGDLSASGTGYSCKGSMCVKTTREEK